MSIRPIKRLIKSKPTLEGAGVHLRRAFGFGDTSEFDPLLLLDDFRNDVPADYLAGFPWHPHRGIETITYVLTGTVEHGDSMGKKLRAERTNLVPKMIETWQEVPLELQLMDGSDPLYGYIGMDDYTLHPFVRPGAFVRIDPRQKKIPAVHWRSDHDRPIFFIELRERYVCTWCEMHEGWLILISSQQSNRRAQHVRYPADAAIIGRVTGISMDIVEPEEYDARA